ncbi:bifunctional metallophosphatase/5'-nucleotidase [Peribacillus asahii]|uniref:bifunctional metallophosphatase/5'-nucleotidase n=1 Tax=Peribacillus asahii TaxID=228899 RepID=UPI00207A5614|nr:5'-nucleotidase C-terminal domain-containing protein [Peribacillus asahii]USK70016.1 5'-nucleotidase C-terminal domain-containing protein [Peribacillus asahii]
MGNKKMFKVAMAAAIAGSVITTVAPTQSEAADSLRSKIQSAKSTMKKPYNTYFKATTLASVATVEKEIKAAKKARKDINAAIKKSDLSKKQKEARYKEIKAYNKYITRAEGYVKGYKAAEKAKAANDKAVKALEQAAVNQKPNQVLKRYEALQEAVKKADKAIKNTVYGAKIEALLSNQFTKVTKQALAGDIKVYYYYAQAEDLIEKGKLQTAEKRMTAVAAQLEKVDKTSVLGQAIHQYVQAVKAKYDAKEKFTLSLMHTNDTHAHLDNVAKRVTAVKEVRASKQDALLVDAGDVLTGTLYFNEFKGQADLRFMNLMKYDVMTFGNHEFDLGSTAEGHGALAQFVKGAEFSFVSSNVNFRKDDKLKGLFKDAITSKPRDGQIYNGIIKEVNGEKVGIFGLTTEETKAISSPGNVEFENYKEEAEKAVATFEKRGVNKIVAVTHIGYDDNPAYDNDLTLATEVDGIDVIVGGHSHTQLDQPVVVNKDEKGKTKAPTVIVQAYQYSDYLGTVDVEFDRKGQVIGQAGQLIKLADKQEDPEAAALLKTYSAKIEEVKNTPTGATAVRALDNPRDSGDETKPSVRKNETELGNLITDGMLRKAKEFNKDTVIAFQNGGGIRAAIDQGEITLGDVLTVLPFGNTLATVKLTGAEIIQALEHSVSQVPKESGGFLHVSGLKFTFDSSKPAGSRVQKVEVLQGGSYSELQLSSEYVVATNAFTAKGGDSFTVFQKAYEQGRVTDIGLADWENFSEYVSGLKTVDPEIEGRIKNVSQ